MKLTKGYKTGKAQTVTQCCREIRIQTPKILGKIYSGYNTITNEIEYWMCLKVKKDWNENVVQLIFPSKKQLGGIN